MAHCGNGGCTKPIYRGKYCYRCWVGTKWFSITQRLRNANGNCKSYLGVPLGFTREQFIKWCLDNPPPFTMSQPSVDRIVDELGYVPGNIQWLEFRANCRRQHKYVPDGIRVCAICKEEKVLSAENFPRNSGKNPPFGFYCLPCNRTYQYNWDHKNDRASI